MSVGRTIEIWTASRGGSPWSAGTVAWRFAVTVTVGTLGSSAAIATAAVAANSMPAVNIRSLFMAPPLSFPMDDSDGGQGRLFPPVETCGRAEERLSAAKDWPSYLQSLEIRTPFPSRSSAAAAVLEQAAQHPRVLLVDLHALRQEIAGRLIVRGFGRRERGARRLGDGFLARDQDADHLGGARRAVDFLDGGEARELLVRAGGGQAQRADAPA